MVGDDGVIHNFDGSTWRERPLPPSAGTAASLDSVWGTSASDVWVSGTRAAGSFEPFAAHWDGTDWELVALLDTTGLRKSSQLTGLGGCGGEVFAVGERGGVFVGPNEDFGSGLVLERVDVGVSSFLYDIACDGDEVVVVGHGDTMIVRDLSKRWRTVRRGTQMGWYANRSLAVTPHGILTVGYWVDAIKPAALVLEGSNIDSLSESRPEVDKTVMLDFEGESG